MDILYLGWKRCNPEEGQHCTQCTDSRTTLAALEVFIVTLGNLIYMHEMMAFEVVLIRGVRFNFGILMFGSMSILEVYHGTQPRCFL